MPNRLRKVKVCSAVRLLSYNIHKGIGERDRHWQVEYLLGHRLVRESAGLPTLIVGDFNDWRNILCKKILEPTGFSQATTPLLIIRHSRAGGNPARLIHTHRLDSRLRGNDD